MKADEPAEKITQRILTAFFAAGLALVLAMAVTDLPEGVGLSGDAQESLKQSGVENSVTAVLLNFRGYDTLLEICVLLLSVLGVMTLTNGRIRRPEYSIDPLLHVLARVLVPLMVLVSGYLLYEGSYAPGGAFQAGAVLGSAIVLSRLAGLAAVEKFNRAFLVAAMLGFAVFLIIAVIPLAYGRNFIEYPPEYAGILIFTIEASLTISIAIILYSLFSGGSAIPSRSHPGGRKN
ncbi:MAG: sodium:proton antiporter [Nitrospirae bacterium]|nr:sodium:proton antiporter [Nitrospirota bacterium]